jgi:hypothetical protein
VNIRSSFQIRGISRQVVLMISLLVFLYTNLLSGGSDSNSIYSLFPTAFTPAVYTFAIWAPIFVGLVAFAIYQALPSNRGNIHLDVLAWPAFIAFTSCALSAYTPIGWSNLVITLALAALIFAFIAIKKADNFGRRFFWCVDLPFSLFFGWITAATIVNAFQWLSSLGFQSFGPRGTLTAAFFIIVASAIGAYITLHFKEGIYGLVLVWAFCGITVAHPNETAIVSSTIFATLILILARVSIFGSKSTWASWIRRVKSIGTRENNAIKV